VGITTSVRWYARQGNVGVYSRLANAHGWIHSRINDRDAQQEASVTYQCNSYEQGCGCGPESVIISSEHIDEGEEAVPFSWTMTVSIRLNDSDEHACSGSILTGFYILTSARCIDGAVPFDISVVAGVHNRIEDFPSVRYIQDVYVHPQWHATNGTGQNDIALLRVFPPFNVPAAGFLARVCIPYATYPSEIMTLPPNASELVVVGWRSTRNGQTTVFEDLQQARVTTLDANAPLCQQSIRDSGKQFCAVTAGKGNVCR
jgi:secreted trypsin-like serine protease